MTISKKIIASLLVTTSILSAQTLVTVNGTKITQSEVDSALMNATQGRFNQVPPEKQREFREQVLKQLVAKELIYSDAKKTGILKSKDFNKEYKKVQERVKKEIAVQIWQKKELDKVKVSQAELKKYYKDNRGEFKEPESVHARHILVKTQEEANALLGDLKLKGKALQKKFIALAKEKSVGPSGPKGGDLGNFSRKQMVPEFDKVVFSMKKGTVSKVVKTQFGYHIIYLEDKKAAKNLSFSEVESFIENRLKLEKFKVTMADTMKKLQKKATIK